MTREEEIKQASEQYTWVGDLYDLQSAFAAGVKWADNNPKEYREKIEQLEIKYFELFKKAREEDKQELIEKTCEWLDSINTDYYMDSGIFQMNDLIRDFKKYLEELK